MIEQQLREIASHIHELQRQERMFIEELRVLQDHAGPDLSERLAAVNDRMDAFTHVPTLSSPAASSRTKGLE